MDRNELTMAIAGALATAFLLGWITRWIFSRLNAGPRDMGRAVGLAADLHAAEDARHRAEGRAAEAEAELAQTRLHLETAERDIDQLRAAYAEATAARNG